VIPADAQSWSKAAALIWSLVSGLPGEKRRKRVLLMLQAFVDDSRGDPAFVLAGYVAPAEQWAAFSDRWQEVLDMPPRLEYFRMTEIFSRWAKDKDYWTERLTLFHDIIEEFASASFAIAFSINNFKKTHAILEPYDRKKPNAYNFACYELMAQLARGQEQLGLSGPIEFIFDEQLMEKPQIIEAWEWMWTVAKPNPPNLKEIIGGTPSFKDDKQVLPLQAADFIAWWMRRRFDAQANGKEPLPAIWKDRGPPYVPGMCIQFNEQELRESAERVLARTIRYNTTGGLTR
jgi:hypothetical protein